MRYFGTMYLDKEKDLEVCLEMEEDRLYYTVSANNHRSDNLINNLARIAAHPTALREGRTVMQGQIPCYIKGDGQRVYVFRINGLKLANIYPDGKIEVNSVIPAIAKTLMSQTKDYKYSYRDTVVKSYVREQEKLSTDLHTHGNANLSADILIALAIKHQIRYPLYYIKKLGLTLSPAQQARMDERRIAVEATLDLTDLTGKYRQRKIDDHTFLNFASLILENPLHADDNIRRIRGSLSILKDSQAVFTNLEKLYLYRYVFTKGIPADDRISLPAHWQMDDPDIRNYLVRMLQDAENPRYQDLTLYEDTLLWIGREYQKRHIRYVEISDTTLVKTDRSNPKMLASIHRILPLVKEETGVDIRFLAAIRRIPLTLVKDSIAGSDYLTEAVRALKVVCKDPYVVGSDFVGEEISDIGELKAVIREIVPNCRPGPQLDHPCPRRRKRLPEGQYGKSYYPGGGSPAPQSTIPLHAHRSRFVLRQPEKPTRQSFAGQDQIPRHRPGIPAYQQCAAEQHHRPSDPPPEELPCPGHFLRHGHRRLRSVWHRQHRRTIGSI